MTDDVKAVNTQPIAAMAALQQSVVIANLSLGFIKISLEAREPVPIFDDDGNVKALYSREPTEEESATYSAACDYLYRIFHTGSFAKAT